MIVSFKNYFKVQLMDVTKRILVLVIFLNLMLNLSYAQNFENGFNFSLPGLDTSSGNFLPDFPIKTIDDFITITQDGHFSAAGKRIKFWGVNIAADGAFPEKSKAELIAGRLRKMGFNIVRFHHLDNSWSTGSLFEQGKDTRHLNPETLDRLDYFLFQLKKNGIYANINLNVSRAFNSLDGVPDADSLKYNAMGVKLFDPQLIALQKEYAQQLLTHVNPYTGLPLVNDPAAAMVEITNENSLYRGWQYGGAKHFSEGGLITWHHKIMLDTLFNSFLIKKYLTTENLTNHWNIGINDSNKLKGLTNGESLENKTVIRIDYSQCIFYSNARVRDMSEFYIRIQNKYFDEMLSYLKNDLHVKVPIVGTNWNVGPGDLISQSRADYIDNHAYWQHPVFPNELWSSRDWSIQNTPMVKDTTGGTIADLFGGAAMVNKPYTISEYDHPFPNKFQTEMMIFTTGYSSFHDADGIMFFDYNYSSTDWDTDMVNGFFNISRNHSIMSLMPSCAYAFRKNLISKASSTIKINYTPDKVYILPKEHENLWENISLFPKKLALVHAIRNESFNADSLTDFSRFPSVPVNPFISDTKELTWNTDGLFFVNTPGFIGVTGILNNFPETSIGALRINEASGFGTFTWISLKDNEPLKLSQYSLITVASSIQNSTMIWDGKTTVHNNWGNAPTQISPLVLKLNLELLADSIRIYPLDKYGNNNPRLYTTYLPNAENRFEILLNQNLSNTLWFGVEQFGVKTTIRNNHDSKLINFNLEQNYPNPFNPVTTISYSIPNLSPFNKAGDPDESGGDITTSDAGFVRLKVYDILGRDIATLVNEKQNPGTYQVKFDGSRLSNGIYLYKLTAGNYAQSKKMILLK